MKIKGNTYEERSEFQLREWAKGNSIHNSVEGECCPDFSCCEPSFKTPEEIRKTFLAANSEQRETFLYSFLGAAVSKATDKKVHLADGKNEINSELN